ncbi:MAG: glycoside hydrolase family 5 protein [Bacteroidia bacterium]
MKGFFLAIFLLWVSSLAAEPLSRISVSGNQFVNETGDTLVFRGLNTSDPDNLERNGHWDEAYFAEMKSWGANVVRFPIHPSRFAERGESAYFDLLDQGIKWAEEMGMYVIIDWHSIGNLRSQMYQHPRYETDKKQTFEFWRSVAKRYGNNPTVAFYELYNEPTIQGGQLGSCSWEQWAELMEEMILIVRANGGQGVPLVAGFNWAYDLRPVRERPIAAEGIAYVSHPYPQKRPKPWTDRWTQDWGFVKDNYPLILTEIGFAGAEEAGAHVPVISDESYGEAITGYCDEHDISYVVWVFDARWAPPLFSDWNYTLTRHGAYFKAKMQLY